MACYLDHNATTPTRPEVVEAMISCLRRPLGNASSVHRHGRAARDALEQARAQVAALVGAQPAEVIFTSGGTEADNLAVKGVCAARSGRVLFGATEHPGVLEAAESLPPSRRAVIPVLADGGMDLEALERLLDEAPAALVAVMLANNETGRIQDLAPIVALARRHGALVHCDAVQAAGRMVLDWQALDVDTLAISAHKIGGPRGVGALIVRAGTDLAPLIHGGGQEQGLRSGTENLPGIVGFGVAAQCAAEEAAGWAQRMLPLRTRLEQGLRSREGCTVFAADAPRLANTCQFAVAGFHGEMLQMMLDRAGFSVSTGSACASGKGRPSHVLLAMGVPESVAIGAVRVSFGPGNTAADVDAFLAALDRITGRAVAAVAP